MTQPISEVTTSDVTVTGLAAAPSVEEALAALTQPRAAGEQVRRFGRRPVVPATPPAVEAPEVAAVPTQRFARPELAKPLPVEAAVAAPVAADAPAAPVAAAKPAAPVVPAAPVAPAPITPAAAAAPAAPAAPVMDHKTIAQTPLDPQSVAAIDGLGPYIAGLMAEARTAAAKYKADAELEATKQADEIRAAAGAEAAAVRAAANAEADMIRNRAQTEASALLDTSRIQAQSLATRVRDMANELVATSELLGRVARPSTDS